MNAHNEAVELRRLRALFDNVPFGLAVSTPQGQVQQINPAILRIFGFAASEEFMAAPAAEHYADPADRQRFVALLRERGSVTDFEARFKRKDGALFPGLTSATRVSSEEGDVFLSTFQDITERRQAEEAGRASSAYARGLIEASLDALVTISQDGKIMDVNKATENATGVPRDRLIGSNFSDYFTEPEKAEQGYQQVLRQGLVKDYPLTIRHASGRTTDVAYNAAVYRNEAGEVQGVFAAARDITERKRAEEALARQVAQEALARQAQEILEISLPVVQVWEAITLVPLIGTLDSQRTQQLVERLLQRIVETNSMVAMLDISGVPAIDTQTAQHLIETISAVRLLGAQVILTGVRPAIARTLVHLGIDLSGVITRASLTDGLRLALEMAGLQVVKREA